MIDTTRFTQMKRDKPFTPLGELVYLYLYEEIIRMNLLPGTKLNESRLADELEVSRTPVKYALNRLSDELLVTKTEGKPMMVSPMNKQDTKKLLEACVAIESKAARLAASRIAQEQLEHMEELARECRRTVENERFADHAGCDHAFHCALIAAADNNYLSDMYKIIESRLLHNRHFMLNSIRRDRLKAILTTASRHHDAVLNALRLGFGDIAASEIEQDINGMSEIFGEWK